MGIPHQLHPPLHLIAETTPSFDNARQHLTVFARKVSHWVNASELNDGIPLSEWDWALSNFGFESRLSRHRNLSSDCVNERLKPTVKRVPAIPPFYPVSPTRDPKWQVLPETWVNIWVNGANPSLERIVSCNDSKLILDIDLRPFVSKWLITAQKLAVNLQLASYGSGSELYPEFVESGEDSPWIEMFGEF